MSVSFEARFATTRLPLAALLERLDAALPDCGLRFHGAMMQLHSHNGWPTIGGLEFGHVDSIAEAAKVGESWWGLGFELVSEVLLEGIGRSDAVEVYLRVFRSPEGPWTMSYLESDTATDHRIASEDAAKNLTALQLAICAAGRFELSMYDEQNHDRDPVPTLRSVEVAIKGVAADPKAGDLAAVVSTKVLDHAKARRLAGARADDVKVSTNGYVVFPLLRAREPAKK